MTAPGTNNLEFSIFLCGHSVDHEILFPQPETEPSKSNKSAES